MATFVKAGIAGLGIVHAAPDKTGAGIEVMAAGGVRNSIRVKAGAGLMVGAGAGHRNSIRVKSGAGLMVGAGSGADVKTGLAVKTGAGLMVGAGGGASAKVASGTTYIKTGLGRMGAASPANVKTGAGVAVFTAGGPDVKVGGFSKTGAGIQPRTGGGFRNSIYVETAAGGENAPEPPSLESDSPPTLVFKASGVKAQPGVPNVKAGGATVVFTASGSKLGAKVKTGAGVLVATAGGRALWIKNKAGVGVLVRAASGSRDGADPVPPDVYPAIVATEASIAITVTDPANGTIVATEDDQLALV